MMFTDGEVSMQEDFKSNDGISKPTQNAQHISNL